LQIEFEFFASREARVYAQVHSVAAERQTREVRLCCDSWDYNEVRTTWTFSFEGDQPNVSGADLASPPNKIYKFLLTNPIRTNHRVPAVSRRGDIVAVCPIGRCETIMSLSVTVLTRKGSYPSEIKPLELFS
jgi:hypothetical protein